MLSGLYRLFFFFNDTATTEIYTLSLHDALPISVNRWQHVEAYFKLNSIQNGKGVSDGIVRYWVDGRLVIDQDRKSTRLNSSHDQISYAVFCLKKKKHDAPEIHARSDLTHSLSSL